MPFVPISDEELKSLNSLESKRFVPISNEELKALNSSLQLASQQPAKGVTRTTTKVSATSTGKLPVAEPYQVPLPDAMVSVSKGRNVASQLPMSPDEFVNAPDFSEKSIYSSGIKDATYQQINAYHGNDPEKKAAFNLQLLNSPAQNFSNKGYAYITEDELKTYNYIHSQLGEKAANSYLDSLGLTSRMTEDNARRNEELAKKHPIITSALSPVLTFAKSAAAVDNAASYLGGNGIDENSFANQGSRAQSSVRGTVSNSIEENIGGIGGKIGSFAYQTGMSIADYLTVLAGSGGNKTAVLSFLSTSAATDALIEGKNKGLSDGQAMLKGVVAGAAEAVFEKIPLDNLFSIGNKSGVTKKVLEVLKQMGLEGAEEVGTDVANAIADGVISGNKSDYNLSVRAYMESGLSEAEARNKAAADFAKQIGMSFAGGAISGGVLGTGAELLNSAGSKKANASTSDQWTNGANDDIMETVKGGSLDGRENAQQENAPGGHAGVPGQIFTVTDSELEKTVPGMERRADYRGVGLAVTEALQKRGITPVALAYTNDSDGFHQAIGRAKQNNMHGAFVTQHEVSEYANDALFLSEDGNTGVAVTPDGDIVSVFKNPNGKAKKAVHSILLTALENGGVKLDNFDGALSDMYWNHGFIPVARTSFDPEFAPTDWNYARDGQPDIIFWVHNGEDAQTVARRIGEYGDLPDLTKLPVMSYDEAAAYRDNILKQRADSGNTGSAFFDADSKGSTDNIDAIVRDVFGYGQQTDAQANPGNGDVQSDKWSKPESQWTAENQNVDANEGAAIKSVTEIVQKIRNAFGIPISTGKFNQRAYGIYKTRVEAIRTKVSDALPTIAHELGHHFDKRYGLYILPSTNEAIQVLISTRPEFAQSYKVEQLPGEAVAEFMRDYLTDRTLAKSKYPAFYDAFVKALPKDQIKKLNSIGDDINRYMFADKRERAKKAIVTRKQAKKIAKSGEYAHGVLRRMEQAATDNLASLNDVSEDGYKRAYQAKDADGIVHFNVKYGMSDSNGEWLYALDENGEKIQAVDSNGNPLFDKNGNPVYEYEKGLSDILSDLFDDRKTRKQKKQDFELYLVVRHGLEWVKDGKRVFADDTLNNEAYMREEAARLEAENPEFASIAAELNRWQKRFFQTWLVDTGMIEQRKAKELWEKYPNYVPFYRAVAKNDGAKASFANQNAPIKRAKGSGLEILSPIESIIKQVDKFVKSAERNAVMQELTGAADAEQGLGRFLEAVPPDMMKKSVSTDKIQRLLKGALEGAQKSGTDTTDIETALDEILGSEISEFVVKGDQGQDVVWVMRDGKREYYQVHDKNLLNALTSMGKRETNAVVKAASAWNRMFKTLTTGGNYLWSITSNIPRDFMSGYLYGSEANPVKYLAQYLAAWKHVVSGDKTYMQYKAGGGGYSSPVSNPRTLDGLVKDATKVNTSGLKGALKVPLEFLEGIADATEAAARVAEFSRALKQGKSVRDSVLAADEVTVNFKRHGDVSKNIDAFFPYFNPSVQGLSKIQRSVYEDVQRFRNATGVKGKMKAATAGFTGKTLLSSAILAAIVLAWNNGDEAKEEYKKLSSYIKNNFYCFYVGGGKFLKIPKAKELAFPESLIERTWEAGAWDNDNSFHDFSGYMASIFLPPGVPDPTGEGIVGKMKPLVTDIGFVGSLAEILANETFTGAPIVSGYYSGLEPWAQYNDRTSWIAKAIGRMYPEASPMKIDHFINSNFGILGNLNQALTAEDKDFLLGTRNKLIADNAYSTDVLNRFYDTLEELEMRANTNPRDGHAVGTYKQYQSMQSVISQLNKFGRESEDDERDFKATARDYASAFQSLQAGKIDERLIALYERTQSKSIFPYKTFSASFTKDGKTVNLTPAQFLDYVDEYERTLEESYQKILSMNISDEKKVEKLEKAKRDLTSSTNKKYGGGSSGSDKLKVPTYEETAIDRLLKGALS